MKTQIEIMWLHHAAGNLHSAAAGLSALIRASWKEEDRQALWSAAKEMKITDHPAFIV